jgi:GWxTD domain-containing protein
MKKLSIVFLIAVLAVSCEAPQRATSINQAFLYNKNLSRLHPEFNIFHVTDAESQLDFLLDASELLYMKQGKDSIQRSSVYISVILHAKFESTEIIDSTSTRITDISDGKNDKFIHGEMKFKATYPNTYYLQVTVTDMNRKVNYKCFLFVDKSNKYNAQNFRIFSDDGRENFTNEIGPKDKIQITGNNPNVRKYVVSYYHWKFHLPAPPFSMKYQPPVFDHKPDSIFSISALPEASGYFRKEGLYLVQTDSSKREGITIKRFYDGYPDVTTADILVNALRFITNKEEFGKLHSSVNKKEAVDKFWLDLAGNEDRAKELISKYYNRVQDANRFFTSYTEGWRTDRGMVYLIFGPPSTIFKSGKLETWYYGERNNASVLNYTFVQENNWLTGNDFQLKRDPSHKAAWYRAVEAWRQGRMYSE